MKKIHEPYDRFKGWLCQTQRTYKDVGELIGNTTTTVNNKVNGLSDFSLSETILIARTWNVSLNIFLPEELLKR